MARNSRIKKDVENILKRDEPARSGGEVQYLKDIGQLPSDTDNLDPVPETIISNEEAGYDQADYDEMEDSAMTPEEMRSSEKAAWSDIYKIESSKPIESWSDLEKEKMLEMTGYEYDELVSAGVTKPDGMTIEELMELQE